MVRKARKVAEEAIEETKEAVAEAERRPMVETLRKIMLASIGAVALAQEELEDFVNRLVERGEIAEKDARKLIRDMRERRKKEAAKAEDVLEKQVEQILSRMSIPTKSDIEALSAKISALADKVEELKKA